MHSGAFEEKPSSTPIGQLTLCSPPRFAPPKGSPENSQKYFQKVTFFRARKTTTQITTKNHQLTTFFTTKNHPKNAQKRTTPL
jgi:hypothetical protein